MRLILAHLHLVLGIQTIRVMMRSLTSMLPYAILVKEKAKNAAVCQQIRDVLEGVHKPSVSKCTFGQWLTTLVPCIHDSIFDDYAMELAVHTMKYIKQTKIILQHELETWAHLSTTQRRLPEVDLMWHHSSLTLTSRCLNNRWIHSSTSSLCHFHSSHHL